MYNTSNNCSKVHHVSHCRSILRPALLSMETPENNLQAECPLNKHPYEPEMPKPNKAVFIVVAKKYETTNKRKEKGMTVAKNERN